MNYKGKIILISLLSFLILISVIIFHYITFNYYYSETNIICQNHFSSKFCYYYTERVLLPTAIFSVSTILISLILLFSKEAVIKAWLRFAMFSFPIYAFFLFLSASFGDGPSGFMSSGFLSFSSEGLVLALSLLYLIISILLITFKSIQEARRPEKKRFWNKWK
jgi:hypothetical protein